MDDDEEDREMFELAYQSLNFPNELVVLNDADSAIRYLSSPHILPFVIISDINMPGTNGLDLRNEIFENAPLREKSLPFVFFTTGATEKTIMKAYEVPIQGIFAKPASSREWKEVIRLMLEYWTQSTML